MGVDGEISLGAYGQKQNHGTSPITAANGGSHVLDCDANLSGNSRNNRSPIWRDQSCHRKIYMCGFTLKSLGEELVVPNSCRMGRDKLEIEIARKPKSEKKSSIKKDAENAEAVKIAGFKQLTANFCNANAKFHRLVPLILGLIPVLAYHELDDKVRAHAKKWGHLVESSEEHELYEVPDGQQAEIYRRLESFRLMAEGVLDLPPMFVVGLVTSYETFVSELVRVIVNTRPEIISSSERNISFRDLVEIGSIPAARERIVEREVDEVMRTSLFDQIGWVEQKLGIKLKDDNVLWPKMIELSERRNLVTHTAGVVSPQYIQNCKKAGCELDNIKAGDRLNLRVSYLREGIDLIFEFGIKLSQVVWRKMVPNDLDGAVDELNQVAFDLIVARRFDLAARLLKFGLEEMKKHGKEAARKQMVVNYANALKLGGNRESAIEILDKEDWSATSDKYRLCVLAVRGETEAVVKMMRSVAEAKHIGAAEFREWPVFEEVRSEPTFAAEFMLVFGEKLFIEPDAIGAPGLVEIDDQGE